MVSWYLLVSEPVVVGQPLLVSEPVVAGSPVSLVLAPDASLYVNNGKSGARTLVTCPGCTVYPPPPPSGATVELLSPPTSDTTVRYCLPPSGLP